MAEVEGYERTAVFENSKIEQHQLYQQAALNPVDSLKFVGEPAKSGFTAGGVGMDVGEVV